MNLEVVSIGSLSASGMCETAIRCDMRREEIAAEKNVLNPKLDSVSR